MAEKKKPRILTFQSDDYTEKALAQIEKTLQDVAPTARRSAAIRRAIRIAAAQLSQKGGS